ARAPFRQVHVPEGRSRLATPGRGAARPRQAGVPGRLRGLLLAAPAALLLDRRHARRHRHDAAHAGDQPRAHPRVPRRAVPERPDEVVLDPPFLPGDDQGVGVLRRVPPGGSTGLRQVPVRLPVREDARVVRPARGPALEGDAGAHPHRQGVPEHRPQHVVLVRARRPGVRGRVRDRRAGRLPRPRTAPAHHRGLQLHQARHPHPDLRVLLRGEGAQRARRHAAPRPRTRLRTCHM
ncbi:MAG: Coproheme decarboxylase HemQ (no EC), partial [uncultured Solirubrobacteraceae bacterium]